MVAGSGPNDSYLGLERRLRVRVEGLQQVLLGPLVSLLARVGVRPDAVSALQIPLALAFFHTLPRWPRYSLLLWLATFVRDSADGMLARRTARASTFGVLWDQACDHTREILVVAVLAHYGVAGALWSTLYAFAYPAFNVVLLLCNRYGMPLQAAVQTHVVLYPALIAYLGWGVNYLTPALALATLAMGAGSGVALWRLHRSM